ncbi:hypothetical protein BX666DRAFT_1389755 [Dichotomocladium elegans]|nr:hypothetical protein BX666DRAFT_1389755 [Dichotomocladium elegans]
MPRNAEPPPPPKPRSEKPRASVPSYMRSTASYESRVHQQRLSHKRRHQVPDFRSSTRINAMDDIRNEMREEDTYIPLSVRVKLFEQGLEGSGRSVSRPRAQEAVRKENPSSSSASRLTRPRSPKLLTSYRSASHRRTTEPRTSAAAAAAAAAATTTATTTATKTPSARSSVMQHRYPTRSTPSGSIPPPSSSHHRMSQTSTEHQATKPTGLHTEQDAQAREGGAKRRKTQHSRLEVKPFRFATDERAAHHRKAFQEKLDMWKRKEEEEDKRVTTTRGIKRKARE